jgi:DNA repair ATPase RecN
MESLIKREFLVGILLLFGCVNSPVNAQSNEVQQLLLNVEKLSQLKNMLTDMKKGYTVIANGYNAVKNISQGNFSLHEVFLDGLMMVNPEIKKYRRVSDIISYQKNLVNEYKAAFSRFKSSDNFNAQEIDYLEKVYQQLFDQSMGNLDELTTVITSSRLRMSDDDRLHAIDRIFADTQDKLMFLRDFNNQATTLSLARAREKSDLKRTIELYR